MDNYKDRFLAEYIELKERYKKLRKMCIKIDAGTLEPPCQVHFLAEQKRIMEEYLNILEIRAEVEGIDLG